MAGLIAPSNELSQAYFAMQCAAMTSLATFDDALITLRLIFHLPASAPAKTLS